MRLHDTVHGGALPSPPRRNDPALCCDMLPLHINRGARAEEEEAGGGREEGVGENLSALLAVGGGGRLLSENAVGMYQVSGRAGQLVGGEAHSPEVSTRLPIREEMGQPVLPEKTPESKVFDIPTGASESSKRRRKMR